MRINSTVYWLLGFTVLLIILKLLGITDKSWWLILSPTWVPASGFVFLQSIYFIIKLFELKDNANKDI